MLSKIRENIFIADEKVTIDELKKAGITVIEFVAPAKVAWIGEMAKHDFTYFTVLLYKPEDGKINKPHVKDIACHIPKYMTENGEIVAVIGITGLVRAAFVVARAVCELESKSIYEIFTEFDKKLKGFEIGKAYL